MRKKELLARRDALNSELKALLNAEGEFNQARASEIETDLGAVEAELSAIEKTEARLRAAATQQPAHQVTVRENLLDKPWGREDGTCALGDFLQAVRLSDTGVRTDPRLTKLAPSGSNEGISSEGGFLVDQPLMAGLLEKTMSQATLAPLCSPINISANANGAKINGIDETSRATGSRWGGIRVYSAKEAETVTATKPKFMRIELELGKLMALCYATNEELEDAALLESVVNTAFPDEFSFKLDSLIWEGTGGGEPLGVMNSPCLVSVAKEGSQTNDTVNQANILKMYSRISARSILRARWFINQDVLPQIHALTSAATAASTPMFIPPGQIAQAPFGTLLGRPIQVIEHASTLGDLGDIMFADFSQYLLASKGGLKSAVSMHVRFLYDEQCFRWTYRVDGQPAAKSAITPAKGTNTTSPFVTLAAR